MNRSWIICVITLFAPLLTVSEVLAQLPADAPELAARGTAPVGTQSIILIDHDRGDLLQSDGAGGFEHRPRELPIEIWYPAVTGRKSAQHVSYSMPAPFLVGRKSDPTIRLRFDGEATRGVRPAPGRFPLVLLSHGYNNRAVGFSNLAENLASKGYVVVAIEHGDVDPAIAGSRLASFAQVLVNRSADQRFVIGEVRRRTNSASVGVFAHINANDVALAGYSMGGYGAITSAGAGLDPKSPLMSQLPKALVAELARK